MIRRGNHGGKYSDKQIAIIVANIVLNIIANIVAYIVANIVADIALWDSSSRRYATFCISI